MKLYRAARDTNYWFAWSEQTGWVKFPPKLNGWESRRPTAMPLDAAEVPLHLAFGTGLLEAMRIWLSRAA